MKCCDNKEDYPYTAVEQIIQIPYYEIYNFCLVLLFYDFVNVFIKIIDSVTQIDEK